MKTHLIHLITCLVCTCMVTTSSFAQPKNMLITDITVVPSHINTKIPNQDVKIVDGTITTISKHNPADSISSDVQVIDGKGKYLVASYADAHAHLPAQEDLERYFLMQIINGVTTLRSMRGADWHLEIDQSAPMTPRLVLSTPPLSRRDTLTQDEVDKQVSSYKEAGYDFIKVLSVPDKETFDHFATSGRMHDLPLAGHCPRNVGIFNVSKAGNYQSVEHLGELLQLPDLETINRAISTCRAKNIYHCPTLDWYFTGQETPASLRERPGVKYLHKDLVSKWEKKIKAYESDSTPAEREESREKSKGKFDYRLAMLNYLYRQGGRLLLSPDASGIYSVPGYGIHTEMQHYREADISNHDILRATTYNLSEMLNTTDEWGTIKAGSRTDLLILSADPTSDISNAAAIEAVIMKGRHYPIQVIQDQLDKITSAK